MSEILVTHFIPLEMHNQRPGSCGAMVPGTTCKIIDLETGKILGPNQSGEICVQGPMVSIRKSTCIYKITNIF